MLNKVNLSKIYSSTVKSLYFSIFCCLFIQCNAQNTIVKTNNGYIKGNKESESLVFKGIPYAKPPAGVWRFKAPQAVDNWTDTLSCENFGNIAPQYDGSTKGLKGSEDCLSLNLYTPTLSPKTKLPVLVWVHGGAMTSGAGKGMDGHAFSDQDSVVTVTINYRLGVFGFLYLGDQQPEYRNSGNNGLLDCIMALKWIKDNISAFGGDPSRVTVMGESAGAKLVSALLVSPKAKSFFQQMVLESGGVQCVRDSTTAKAIRQRLMDTLKISRPADLFKLSTAQLIIAQNKVCNGAQGTNYFGPVNDGSTITEDPYLYLKQNPSRDIRLLMGSNKFESRMFMGMDQRLYHPDQQVLSDWFGLNSPFVLSAYQKAIKTADTSAAAMTVLTQYMYQMHTYRLADVLAKNGNPVWMYRFDYKNDDSGASHADELAYVWYNPAHTKFNDQEVQLAQKVHHAWVNFIKGRKPGHLNQYDWYWYKTKARSIMVFDRTIHPELLTEVYNDPDYPTAGFILSQ